MSKTQEAIKDGCEGCPKKVCMWGGFVGDCPLNTSGKSEPALNQSGTGQEPGEFTKEKIDVRIFEGMNWVNARDWNKARALIDRLQAVLSFTKQELDAADLEIKRLRRLFVCQGCKTDRYKQIHCHLCGAKFEP